MNSVIWGDKEETSEVHCHAKRLNPSSIYLQFKVETKVSQSKPKCRAEKALLLLLLKFHVVYQSCILYCYAK